MEPLNISRYYPYKMVNTIVTGAGGRVVVDCSSPTFKNIGTTLVQINGSFLLIPGESFGFIDSIGERCVQELQIGFYDPANPQTPVPENTGNQLLIVGKIYVNGFPQT